MDRSTPEEIPRRLHWVWLGDRPIPDQQRRWMREWERMHPRWESSLWTEANRPVLRNEASFRASGVPAQQADILRYEVVYRHGGVYLDTDMECLRPLDDLLYGVQAFTGEQEPGSLGTGIFGATAGHPWLRHVIEELPESLKRHSEIPAATGPGLFTEVTASHPEVTVMAPEIFYPYQAHEPSRAGGPFPAAYAVHRWHGSWLSEEDRFLEDFPLELERELRGLLAPGARVVTLAEGIELDLGAHQVLPFTGRDGHWGHPEDDEAAIDELERLLEQGWNWLVVLEDGYWWFDSYAGFMGHVQARAGAVHRRRRFVAFDLGAGDRAAGVP